MNRLLYNRIMSQQTQSTSHHGFSILHNTGQCMATVEWRGLLLSTFYRETFSPRLLPTHSPRYGVVDSLATYIMFKFTEIARFFSGRTKWPEFSEFISFKISLVKKGPMETMDLSYHLHLKVRFLWVNHVHVPFLHSYNVWAIIHRCSVRSFSPSTTRQQCSK